MYRNRQNCSLLASLSFPEMAVRVIFGSAASSVSFSFDTHPSERRGGARWGNAVELLAAVESGVVKGVLWLFESLITSRREISLMPDWNGMGVRMAFSRARCQRAGGIQVSTWMLQPVQRLLLPSSTFPSMLPGDATTRGSVCSVCSSLCTLVGLSGETGLFLLASLQGSGSWSELSGGPRCCHTLSVTGGFALSGLCSPCVSLGAALRGSAGAGPAHTGSLQQDTLLPFFFPFAVSRQSLQQDTLLPFLSFCCSQTGECVLKGAESLGFVDRCVQEPQPQSITLWLELLLATQGLPFVILPTAIFPSLPFHLQNLLK